MEGHGTDPERGRIFLGDRPHGGPLKDDRDILDRRLGVDIVLYYAIQGFQARHRMGTA